MRAQTISPPAYVLPVPGGLNGEHLAVEGERDSGGGLDRVLAIKRLHADARRAPEEMIDGCAIGLAKREPLFQYGLAEVLQCVPEGVAGDVLVEHDRLGVIVFSIALLPDVDGLSEVVHRCNRPERLAGRGVDTVALTCVQLLCRVAVPLHLRTLLLDNPFKPQATHRAPLVLKFVFGKAAQAEVLPPTRLVLPAVELHHVRQREPRLLFVGSVGRVGRSVDQELVAQFLQLPVQLAHFAARRSVGEFRTRNLLPALNHFGTKHFQPVPQLQRGLAILPVVILDDAGVPVVRSETPFRDRVLHHSPARGCLPQILPAFVAEERLEVLDGVPLDAGDQGPLDDPVQIHEGLAAQ